MKFITVFVLLFVYTSAFGAKEKGQAVEPDYTKGEKIGEGPYSIALGPIGAIGNVWSATKSHAPTKDTRMIQVWEVMKGTPADGVLQAQDVILGVISPTVLSPEAGTHTPSLPAANPPRSSEDPKDPLSRGVPDVSAKRNGDGRGVFSWDARKVLSAAITEAEKKENGGKLVLNIWRPETKVEEVTKKNGKKTETEKKAILKEPASGKIMQVTLVLPIKGTYSATAPWDCEKTKKIIDEAAQSIVKKGFSKTNRNGDDRVAGGVENYVDALGLLATGEEKYLPVLGDYARTVAHGCEDLNIMTAKFRGEEGGTEGISSWHGSYRTLFLAEYYLITKDQEVLPGLTALSTFIALGVSGVGTWSHGMANVRRNGLYGPPCAYGAMNQCSETCALSLLLAQKCGINKPEINDAVQRSLKFYRWYVDKGTIPYGDNPPAEKHDNNGRNSQAAVLFDLAGDKEAADFFTRSTLASYTVREGGHTGHFFSWQWGALGAARGGPEAAQSFIRNTSWYTELERRPDGGSVYQPTLMGGEHGKYKGWSTTGSRLMQYCLPRKALYITGKGGSCVIPITGADLKTVVDAATFDPARHSVKELLAALGNWSMVVRKEAAEELGKRNEDVTKDLIAMLDSPNRYARYGACAGLEFAGRKSDAGVEALIKKVESDKDLTMRFFAVNAMALPRSGDKENGLGSAVLKAAPALLKRAAVYEPEQDPMRKLHAIIASLMFYGGHVSDYTGYFAGGKGSEKIDRALLIPAMKSFLINPNGGARSSASAVYAHLSDEDLKQLWGDIFYATKKPAPSGVMFAGAVRMNGIGTMASHHVKEGLEIGPDIAFRIDAWGQSGRGIDGIPALKPYGQALKDYYPDIEKVLNGVRKAEAKGKGKSGKQSESLEKDYETIKKTPAPQLWSIAPYIEAYEKANGIKK